VAGGDIEKQLIDSSDQPMNKRKIINDPVFGFINIPDGVVYEIIQHPYFQRLHRIKQLGLSMYVYPGAQHTRMQHSLGAMHLMGEAIEQLRAAGHEITPEEEAGAKSCILLHDIGHGPFSHALEHSLVPGVSHEELSVILMEEMNREFDGRLAMAIQIFRNEYPKRFLHQLVSGQLDMDRLDYLSRDSFFSGVSEGIIGSSRIIKMLNLHEGQLVVEAKGIYSIEKFLVARRLMYWQVYLHKTSVAAEKMLVNILKRAKQLASEGKALFGSPSLQYFLYNDASLSEFEQKGPALHHFVMLDDSDFISAIKVWSETDDKVLSLLCTAFINRKLFKVEIKTRPSTAEELENWTQRYCRHFGITSDDAQYFMADETVSTDTYSPEDDTINILMKDGTIKDIAQASDMLNITVLTRKVQKHYFCYYRIPDPIH
jgi:HD superfamily phosphohydrolase